MTVQQLIDKLMEVKDKSKKVSVDEMEIHYIDESENEIDLIY